MLSIFLSNNYRDFIYKNKIYDFGIADAGGNLFVVPLLSIFIFIFKPELGNNYVIYRVVFFYIFTEILSFTIPYLGVFDSSDLIAYLIGGIFSVIFFSRLSVRINKIL